METKVGKVKEMLERRPFSVQESMYSLARRILPEVECDLNMTEIPEDQERDLIRLRDALKEIIKYENTDSRVHRE
jgi:hypothetical protein